MSAGVAFQAIEAEIRAALHDDIKAVWKATRIHDDLPELAAPNATLPVAFIYLNDPEPNSEEGGMQEEGLDLVYEISLRQTKPNPAIERGVTIQAAKLTATEALRKRLTGDIRYLGWNRLWLGESHTQKAQEMATQEAQQPYFTVTLRFQVTITVPAF